MRDHPITVTHLALPKGGGALRGIGETFQTNAFTGTSALSIPVHTSSCRGFEPTLSVDYSSGSGNGLFGIGFGLAIPNVARKTEKGIPRYDDSDTFILSGADDLIPALTLRDGTWVPDEEHLTDPDSGTTHIRRFRPRTEGLFARIEAWTQLSDGDMYWRVTTKQNITNIYGRSTTARVSDPADPSRIYKWLLEESWDAKGNHVRYVYRPDNNGALNRILYGNHIDAQGQERWHFEVIFDYGERSLDNLANLSYSTTQDAPRRADPFSSYRSGFRIHTERLCRAILMFHRFDGEFNGEPFAVHCTRFDYEETPYVSQMRQVTQIGLRRCEDGYAHKAMPPLNLCYSKPRPLDAAADFMPLTVGFGNGTSGPLLQQPIGELVDLYGDGLAGILFSDDQTTLYLRPQGDGRYAPPTAPTRFPIDRDLQSGRFSLTDLGGDGKLDLVMQSPAASGYFQGHPDGSWDALRSFAAYPLESFAPDRQMFDVTGDGLADVVLFEAEAVKVYPSQGKLGYAPATVCPRPDDLPMTSHTSRAEVVRIADMFGDGGSHIVRIRNGSISCWPHLGYGRYGERIDLHNAPRFGDQFDADRLFLTDLDGTGAPDLVYAEHDHLAIYRNQSGNGFGEREVLHLPRAYDNLDQIRFADVLGTGAACLVLTTRQPDLALRHDTYDFSGGVKPHLLIKVDNNMGALTRINYASSTQFSLADQRAGRPWRTRLSFPVQVIKSIEIFDQIAETRQVTRYAYHDGYFDPIEREFRGFGYVEQWDTESFEINEARRAHDRHAVTAGEGENQDPKPQTTDEVAYDEVAYVAPVYTRSWYHNGAQTGGDTLSAHYKDDYYQGDSLSHRLPDSAPERRMLFTLDDPSLFDGLSSMDHPSQALWQAFADHGITLGPDGDLNNATLRSLPGDNWRISNVDQTWAYGVTREDDQLIITDEGWQTQSDDDLIEAYRALHGHLLRQEVYGDDAAQHPKHAPHPYRVTESNFTVRLVQPRLGQENAVCFPHPRETITYHYERNPEDPRAEHVFTVDVDEYGQVVTACHLSYPRRGDDSYDEQRQAHGVATVARFANLASEPDASTTEHLLGVAVEEQTFELGGLASLSASDKPKYLSSNEIARHLRKALRAPVNHEEPVQDGGPNARRLSWARHYYWDEAQGEALPLGEVTTRELHHHSEQAVFSTAYVAEVFDNRVDATMLTAGGYRDADDHWWRPGLTQHYWGADGCFMPQKTVDVFKAEVKIKHDDYHLLPISISDAGKNVTCVKNDYRTLQPWHITDINDNISETLFDPLGMVIATSIHGAEEASPQGDAPLDTYTVHPDVGGHDVMDSPDKVLGGATTHFFYDLHAWQDRGQPPYTVNLQRETHLSNLIKDAKGDVLPSEIQVHVTYVDGFGRTLQTKLRAGDKGWLTSGGTLYNNKNHPVKQYEPSYRSTPDYEAARAVTQLGVTHVTHYDPLGRVIRVDAPDGSFSKVVFTPWEESHYDANDTILDAVILDRPADDPVPAEDHADALAKAQVHRDTPERHVLDSLGQPFLVVEKLTSALTDAEVALSTYHRVDVQGHERFSVDPRLYAKHGTQRRNFEHWYDMGGVALKSISADAGAHWILHNALGNPIHLWDSRGFHTVTRYDPLQRPVELFVEGDDGDGLVLNQVIERTVYADTVDGDADASAFNLRGRVVEHYDQAGRVGMESYSLHGLPLKVTRQLRAAYQDEADWSADNEKAWTKQLEDESFVIREEHDALGRVTRVHQPVGDMLTHTYHPEGWLATLRATGNQPGKDDVKVRIAYNARGQRAEVRHGDNVTTTYRYDDFTHHLAQMTTQRGSDGETLQALTYAYDPAGNITRVRDRAHATTVANQQVVAPTGDYTYDSLYRLVQATGREHPAMDGAEYRAETPAVFKHSRYLNLNNMQQLSKYTETYIYDRAGNRIKLCHQGAQSWTQSTLVDAQSNRARSIREAGRDRISPVHYDAHGNMRGQGSQQNLDWNYRDNLAAVDLVTRGGQPCDDREFYVYDSGGRRVRKVTETLRSPNLDAAGVDSKEMIKRKSSGEDAVADDPNAPLKRRTSKEEATAVDPHAPLKRRSEGDTYVVEINETIYLGALDIHRVRQETRRIDPTDATVSVTKRKLVRERHSIYVNDGDRRAAVIHRWPVDARAGSARAPQARYQLDDHLGSVALELTIDGQRISYEVYYPYGGTALIAGQKQREVAPKTYRYSGKERDSSTGFYYYGMRYYAPWLGRWMSPDPAGTVDGLNLYAFVRGNPITLVDHFGLCGKLQDVAKVLRPGLTNRRNADIIPRSKPPSKSVGIGSLKKEVYYSYKQQTQLGLQGGRKKDVADSLFPETASHTQGVSDWKDQHESNLPAITQSKLHSGRRNARRANIVKTTGKLVKYTPAAPAAPVLNVAARGIHGVAAYHLLGAANQEEKAGGTTATTAHVGYVRSQGTAQRNKAIPLPFTGQGKREEIAAAQVGISAHGRSGGTFTTKRPMKPKPRVVRIDSSGLDQWGRNQQQIEQGRKFVEQRQISRLYDQIHHP